MGSRSPSQPGQTAGWFPGLRLGPQRAPGTPGRSGSGQPGSGRQTAWPQAQGQVAPQRSCVKATTGCVMCAAVPAASGTWDDTQSQTFVRGPGVQPAAPPGMPGAAGGRGQAQVVPRKLAAHGPARGCVLRAQSPLSSSSPGVGRQKASRRRAGHSRGLLQVTPPRRVQRLWVPRVWQGPRPSPQGGPSGAAFQGHPAGDSGRPGPDAPSSRLRPGGSLWAGPCCRLHTRARLPHETAPSVMV